MLFDSAHNQENAPRKAVVALTTLYFTALKEFSTKSFWYKVSQKSSGGESSGMPSVSDVKGLLQITEVELEPLSGSKKVLVLGDSACSHSWISKRLADKLQVKGNPTKLTVHGINSQQLIDTGTVELKLTPVHSGGSCSSIPVKPSVRNHLRMGNDFIDVDNLKAT